MYACDPEHPLIDPGAALRRFKNSSVHTLSARLRKRTTFSNLSDGAQGRGSLLHNHLGGEIINQLTMLGLASVPVTQVIC